MVMGRIIEDLRKRKRAGQSGFALLVDPDRTDPGEMRNMAERANAAGVDYLLMGGSLIVEHQMEDCIRAFKSRSPIPVILFPGSPAQVSPEADALLFLALVSGRNPELLIGQHVQAAPMVRQSGLEVIPTGYMLIDGGAPTTASYMSHAQPIPSDKPDIALCTAWAAELLGKHLLYMDAGSGAPRPIDTRMISKVASQTEVPLFVGGGIRSPQKAYEAARSGATMVVVGNAIEKDPGLIREICQAIHEPVFPGS